MMAMRRPIDQGQKSHRRRHSRAGRDALRAAALALLVWIAPLAACGERAVPTEPAAGKGLGLLDLLCIYTPGVCHRGQLTRFFGADPRTIYVRKMQGRNSHTLYIPIGHVSELVVMAGGPVPEDTYRSDFVALLPDFAPRTPANVHRFFTPLAYSRIDISVGLRAAAAQPWPEVAADMFNAGKRSARNAIRREDRFGLEVWGENFQIWPELRPCLSLSQQQPRCSVTSANDVMRPLKSDGPPSVISCIPLDVPDKDAKVESMNSVEQAAYVESKTWSGVTRAMCTHTLYYAPMDAHVYLRYSRRFLEQWRDIENRVRELLVEFERPVDVPDKLRWR